MEKRWAKRGLIGASVIVVGVILLAFAPITWHALVPYLNTASERVGAFLDTPVKDISTGGLLLILFVGAWLAKHTFVVTVGKWR